MLVAGLGESLTLTPNEGESVVVEKNDTGHGTGTPSVHVADVSSDGGSSGTAGRSRSFLGPSGHASKKANTEGPSGVAPSRLVGRRKVRGKPGLTQPPKPRGAPGGPKRTPLHWGDAWQHEATYAVEKVIC